jgi:HK97 family phage prohead protease
VSHSRVVNDRYARGYVELLLGQGWAYKHPDSGRAMYPIMDREDLRRALLQAGPHHGRPPGLSAYLRRRARELDRDDRGFHGAPGKPGPTRPDPAAALCSCDCDACEGCSHRDDSQVSEGIKGDDALDGSSSQGNTGPTGVADGSGSRTSVIFDVRAAQADAVSRVLLGLASGTNSPYKVHDATGIFDETMARGAFRECLEQPIQFLYNHGGLVLARAPASMRVWEAPDGLRFRAELNDTQASHDLYAAVLGGQISQCSIGMIVSEDEWNAPAYTQRVVKTVGVLVDCSAVSTPANPKTWLRAAGSEDARALEREATLRRIQQLREREAA